MRFVVAAALLALLWARSARRKASVTCWSSCRSPGPRTRAAGTWTLFASGVLLAAGTSTCDDTGCTFIDK